MPMSVGAMKRDYCAHYPIPCLKEAIMSNKLDITQMDFSSLSPEEIKALVSQLQQTAKDAKEAERAANKARKEAEKALKNRPAGVLVKLAESIVQLSKERLGGKLQPYGGTDAASLGKRTAACIQHGWTKDELLVVLLEALGKNEAHEDAPLHRATIGAQIPKRIQSRLDAFGVQLASGRGEGQKELRYLAFSAPKQG